MQEVLPRPQGRAILEDMTFLYPAPQTLALDLVDSHVCTQAQRTDPEKQTRQRKWPLSRKSVLKEATRDEQHQGPPPGRLGRERKALMVL